MEEGTDRCRGWVLMNAELLTLTLAILGVTGAWTASVAALALWLAGRFRELEKLIYREIHEHKEQTDAKLKDHENRISRLEIKTYGFNLPQGLIPPQP